MKRKVWLFLLLGVLVNITPLLAQNENGCGNLSESRQLPERMYGVMIIEDWAPYDTDIEGMRACINSYFEWYHKKVDISIDWVVYIANNHILIHFSSLIDPPEGVLYCFNVTISDTIETMIGRYYTVHASLVTGGEL